MNNPRRKPARRAASTAGNEVWARALPHSTVRSSSPFDLGVEVPVCPADSLASEILPIFEIFAPQSGQGPLNCEATVFQDHLPRVADLHVLSLFETVPLHLYHLCTRA
jgi:hypothetical protein